MRPRSRFVLIALLACIAAARAVKKNDFLFKKYQQEFVDEYSKANPRINMTVEVVTDYKPSKKYTCEGVASIRNFKLQYPLNISVGKCEDGKIKWWYDNPWSRASCEIPQSQSRRLAPFVCCFRDRCQSDTRKKCPYSASETVPQQWQGRACL